MSTKLSSNQSPPLPPYDPNRPWAGLLSEYLPGLEPWASAIEGPLNSDKWLESWRKATYLQEFINLLHCGLGTRDDKGHCPLLGLYLHLADDHYRGPKKENLSVKERLSTMAFKMLCKRVFLSYQMPHQNATMSTYIYRPEDVAVVMYFFRAKDKLEGESDNHEDIGPEQREQIGKFMERFVTLHWELYCDCPELRPCNDFLKKNRHAALRMAYRTEFLNGLTNVYHFRFHAKLTAEDLVALRRMVLDPGLNKWNTTDECVGIRDAVISSRRRNSALATWELMKIVENRLGSEK